MLAHFCLPSFWTKIEKEAQWDMMFADDIALSRQNHKELKEDLEIWRNALERRGLKVSRSKIE